LGAEVRRPLAPACTHILSRPRACRYANETVTSDVERSGNPLEHDLSTTTEYLVHGHFLRSQTNRNGVWGAWHVDLYMLIRDLGKTKTEELLELFESKQKAIRNDAIATAEARLQVEQQAEEAAPAPAAVAVPG